MAKLKILIVKDSKMEEFGEPKFTRTIPEALRTWEELCNDGQSFMSKYPSDYTLYTIGEYDTASAEITLTKLTQIAKAIDYKKPITNIK